MAKITGISAVFAGKRVDASVEYSSKEGSFYVRIPEELFINNLLPEVKQIRVSGKNYNCVSADSEGAATNLFKRYAETWNNISKKERKVIMIEFEHSSNRISTGWGRDRDRVAKNKRSSIFDSDSDLEIKMNMRIAIERTIGRDITYFNLDKSEPGKELLDNDNGRRDGWSAGWTIVDWTQEREDFCRKLYDAFGDLIDLVLDKFKDEKSFLELVNGKVKLLN